jgi:hypothetical protein
MAALNVIPCSKARCIHPYHSRSPNRTRDIFAEAGEGKTSSAGERNREERTVTSGRALMYENK